MGLFRKKAPATEVAALRDELLGVQERLARSEEAVATLAGRPMDDLQAQLADLAERISASDGEAHKTAARLAATEARLTAVSTELANQLRELSSDIDALADAPTNGGQATTPDEVVEALRAGQAKLANEQARYEIAFRQDLASLAEQVRRLTGR